MDSNESKTMGKNVAAMVEDSESTMSDNSNEQSVKGKDDSNEQKCDEKAKSKIGGYSLRKRDSTTKFVATMKPTMKPTAETKKPPAKKPKSVATAKPTAETKKPPVKKSTGKKKYAKKTAEQLKTAVSRKSFSADQKKKLLHAKGPNKKDEIIKNKTMDQINPLINKPKLTFFGQTANVSDLYGFYSWFKATWPDHVPDAVSDEVEKLLNEGGSTNQWRGLLISLFEEYAQMVKEA